MKKDLDSFINSINSQPLENKVKEETENLSPETRSPSFPIHFKVDHENKKLHYMRGDFNPRVPLDNERLLERLGDCKKLIKALTELGEAICPELLRGCSLFLFESEQMIEKFANPLIRDTILNHSKLFTLNVVKRIYGTLTHLPLEKNTSMDKLNSLLRADSYSPDIKNLESLDLRIILDDIEDKIIFFKNPLKVTKSFVSSPFVDKNLAPTASSLIMRNLYEGCISKNNTFDFKNGIVTLNKPSSIGDFSLIFEDSEDLELSQTLYKVFSVLITYWYEHKTLNNEAINVSGEDILKIINQDSYLERLDSKKVIRRNKIYNLNELNKYIQILKTINVFSREIRYKEKNKTKTIGLEQTPLIIFERIRFYPYDVFPEFKEKITDLHITFKVGGWFKYFDGYLPNLKQFDYVHKEAYSSKGLNSDFLLWLPNALGSHQTGDFKITTILKNIGFSDKLYEALDKTNENKSKVAQYIFKHFNKALKELRAIEDPYIFEYKSAPPLWVTERNIRKPKGWFEQWLNLVIVIKHPDVIFPDKDSKDYKRQKPKSPTNSYNFRDLTEALEKYKDHPKVSIRRLTEKLEKKHPWLHRRLDVTNPAYGKLTPSEIKKCIELIYEWVK